MKRYIAISIYWNSTITAASNADDEEDPIASDDETAKNEMYIEDDEVSTQEWTFWWPIINSGPT